VVLHDALADGQAQAGALLLGGEEGDEEAAQVTRRNAHPGVAKAHLQEGGRGPAPGRAAQAGRDLQLASLGHGLQGVEGQVEEHLAQLLGVRAHLGQAVDEGGGDLHLAGPLLHLLQQQQRLLHHVVHVEGLLVAAVGAGVVEELGDDLVQPIDLLHDDVEELLDGGVLVSCTMGCSTCAAPLIDPSGLRISWARPAAI
jgi:hypothetical protein